MKLLAALDLSPATSGILDTCRQILTGCGGELTLLHVVEPSPDAAEDGSLEEAAELPAAYRNQYRLLQGHAQQLQEAGIAATPVLAQGRPVETVLEHAARVEADLLVIGSHGHGALYDIVVGSMSLGILRAADIPVIVVPTRGD